MLLIARTLRNAVKRKCNAILIFEKFGGESCGGEWEDRTPARCIHTVALDSQSSALPLGQLSVNKRARGAEYYSLAPDGFS